MLKERKKKKGETRENPRKAKQSKAQEKEGQMGKKPKSKAKAKPPTMDKVVVEALYLALIFWP